MADFGYVAELLPASGHYMRSGWYRLDPYSRELLLEETLASMPGYYVDGEVDYENDREPLLTEYSTGQKATLYGEVVQGPGDPLLIGITGGSTRLAGGTPYLIGLLLTGALVYLYLEFQK